MATFTSVDENTFAHWAMTHFSFRQVTALSPIAEGIENTNYRFHADGHDYVFTIFERWDDDAVAYYADLMRHTATTGLPVPVPLVSRVKRWQEKPCLIVPFVDGEFRETPDADTCRQIGEMVARLHLAVSNFDQRRPNPRNIDWRRDAANELRPLMSSKQQTMIDEALRCDAEFAQMPLPVAACHCDLFRHNVLWKNGTIAAIIDFYFGGDDTLIFDLAVCICDWCFVRSEDDEFFMETKVQALLDGYCRLRRLCALEKQSFTHALSVAASRFWLSRHHDIHFPRQAQMLTPHDPKHFEIILRVVKTMHRDLDNLVKAVA